MARIDPDEGSTNDSSLSAPFTEGVRSPTASAADASRPATPVSCSEAAAAATSLAFSALCSSSETRRAISVQ
eukprot:CAMPEP_0172189532 /NCGR_PEP_ID=MMETSP1050-20130122/22575_1 /TAXON_ID=233186 /ORGANISM="Cryptomonas curvata, Strain CCAP979/52" /LENGTH=71 /DNA_ID=CAMNT_0012864235 /DNA_START=469 /DNA_END=684 /DNA_ORIENTATION=+